MLHKKNGFGKSPDIPSGYSENLCCSLFGLTRTKTIENDAKNSNSDFIEIKATGTEEGKTTISKKGNFTKLIWLYFDFENDLLKTYTIKREYLDLDGGEGRKSIRLKTIVRKHNINSCDFPFILSNSHSLHSRTV